MIDFDKTLDRLDKEATFYVSDDILAEFRQRVREQQRAQQQSDERV